MTSGYDRRSRFTKREGFLAQREASGVNPTNTRIGDYATVSETVTSFRDDVHESKRVPEAEVDPYLAGFHRSPGGISDYFDPSRRLMSDMEDAGLITDGDRIAGHSRGFIPDNGHPFTKVDHQVKTSLSGAKYRIYNLTTTTPTSYAAGGPVAVGQMSTTTAGASKVLFPLQGSSAGRKVAKFNEGLSFADIDDDLADKGTIAISQCAPGTPEISVAAMAGELVQALPGIPGTALLKSLRGSSVGDEYLNLVFGLIPTISDAQDLAKVLRTMSMRLHQLRRDNGRPVRRKFGFPTSVRAEILNSATTNGDIQLGDSLIVGVGDGQFGFDLRRFQGTYGTMLECDRSAYASASLFMKETRWTWFKGSFTYVLPEIPGYYDRLEKYLIEYDRLLGLSFDFSSAWQVTPWSWLIDWFIDISTQMDVLTVNFDDNLVLNYGYAMQSIERQIVAKVEYTNNSANSFDRGFVVSSLTSRYKRRIRANPYGFVLQTDGDFWSSYRLAVLGALGLSRL